jgi:dsDNA-specific endonuclease/ATPase MutS2
MKSYSVEKKKEAVAYGKKMMSDFDKQVKDLEGQISRDTSAAKADAQRQLKDLKAQRAATGKKLDELSRASAQSWDSMKHGFADAYKDLQQSYDKAVASLKK